MKNPIGIVSVGRADNIEDGEDTNSNEEVEGIFDEIPTGIVEASTLTEAVWKLFLGNAASWYKMFIIFSLILNPLILVLFGKTACSWAVLAEFIFTLAMALQAYPLQPGGLLVVEAMFLGLTSPKSLLKEVEANLNVILMVVFMVASIHFMKNMLLWIFTKILLLFENKTVLSVFFLLTSTVLSAFLDALTVAAVVVSVGTGFLAIYYYVVKNTSLPMVNSNRHIEKEFELVPKPLVKRLPRMSAVEINNLMLNPGSSKRGVSRRTSVRNSLYTSRRRQSGVIFTSSVRSLVEMTEFNKNKNLNGEKQTLSRTKTTLPPLKVVMGSKIEAPEIDSKGNAKTLQQNKALRKIEYDIDRFKAFLRSLLMHSAVGTAFGGILSMVGQPQNLVIAKRMNWNFSTFLIRMSPVWMTVIPAGIVLCILCEQTKHFGYGTEMPLHVRTVLTEFADNEYGRMKKIQKVELIVQSLGAILLCCGLVLHIAEVGFVGLGVAIIVTSFSGVTEEHEIAHAFLESMPFVSLLVVFFGVVAIIHDQHLFQPIISWVLNQDEDLQPAILFIVNGVLSMVSDNVFVATVFIEEVGAAFKCCISPEQKLNQQFMNDFEHHATCEDKLYVSETCMTEHHFDRLGISVTAGTNLPSLGTPNGQAGLLFILTSNLAPLIHLSYRKMILMAFPYTVLVSVVGILSVVYLTK
eukprot:g3066.t1